MVNPGGPLKATTWGPRYSNLPRLVALRPVLSDTAHIKCHVLSNSMSTADQSQ